MRSKSSLPSARIAARQSMPPLAPGSSSIRVARPCRRALRRERNLPPGVRGPVLREALRLLDSILRMEGIAVFLLLVFDLLHLHDFYLSRDALIEGLASAFGELAADANLLQRRVQLSAGRAQAAVEGCERHLRLRKCSAVECVGVVAGRSEARFQNSTFFRIRAPRLRLLPRQHGPILAVGNGGGM